MGMAANLLDISQDEFYFLLMITRYGNVYICKMTTLDVLDDDIDDLSAKSRAGINGYTNLRAYRSLAYGDKYGEPRRT